MTLEDIKFYFVVLKSAGPLYTASYDPSVAFEEILQAYAGNEMALKEGLHLAPVKKSPTNIGWAHTLLPNPEYYNEWLSVVRYTPFSLEGMEGRYILEFTGSFMLASGRVVPGGSVDNFEDIFTKLIAPRSLRVKRMDQPVDKFTRIDSSLFRF